MTQIDLEHIKAAARAATPGPWTVDEECLAERGRLYVAKGRPGNLLGRILEVFENCLVRGKQRQANAEFIAAANPVVVLELIERLERAEQAINDPRTTGIQIHENIVSMGLQGGACQILAATLAEQFRRGGAINYIEMSLDHSDAEIGPLLLTLQRRQGKTPHALRSEAEADYNAATLRANANAEMFKAEQAESAKLRAKLERLQSHAFWVTAVDEFDDLAPLQLVAGAMLNGVEPTSSQARHLALPINKRLTRVFECMALPDPTTIIS